MSENEPAGAMDPELRARAMHLFGNDSERLAELAEVADLLSWISTNIRRLQDFDPHVPPPAIVFRPQSAAPDFWRGPTGDD